MLLLCLFAFLAGVVTVLSPCILPVLPLILSSGVGDEGTKARPLGVVVGFVLSFTLFTLFLSTLVRVTGISPDVLRTVSIVIIAAFGLSLLIPSIQLLMERGFSFLTRLVPQRRQGKGFGSGVLVGASLGLLWTPCVGPILASVITLALTGEVTSAAFLITLAYALGTAIPMLLIMWGGRSLLQRVPWLLRNAKRIQQSFGVLMILTAGAISFNLDRTFQSFIVETFPRYGIGLTKFEDQDFIRKKLEALRQVEPLQKVRQEFSENLLPKEVVAPELTLGGSWINSQPLSLKELRGKVVLIDFWTYSCINCQRTLPYLKKWYEKYGDQGLVIIGVHAPEFEFEKNIQNVRKAVQDFGLTYPIMQDNNFATWRSYNNHYWPAKYFIDKDGFIRSTHFGEGSYEQSEQIIQELLKETGVSSTDQIESEVPERSVAKTPETYLGYDRLESFASREPIKRDEMAQYSVPDLLPKNSVAYQGSWQVFGEHANPKLGSSLLVHFDARKVYLVMRPVGKSAKVQVKLDGKIETSGEGSADGVMTITEDRLYTLVSLPVAGDHQLQLDFIDGEVEVYALTFG